MRWLISSKSDSTSRMVAEDEPKTTRWDAVASSVRAAAVTAFSTSHRSWR